jgi:hypothetical protein
MLPARRFVYRQDSLTAMPRVIAVLRYAWALPATAVGLLAAACALCAGASLQLVDGAFEVGGGRLAQIVRRTRRTRRFVAITFGHVIIGVDHSTLRRVRAHERVHVQQYERWGPLFFPLYLGSSVVQWLCGRDPYADNRFEREAYACELKMTDLHDQPFA